MGGFNTFESAYPISELLNTPILDSQITFQCSNPFASNLAVHVAMSTPNGYFWETDFTAIDNGNNNFVATMGTQIYYEFESMIRNMQDYQDPNGSIYLSISL